MLLFRHKAQERLPETCSTTHLNQYLVTQKMEIKNTEMWKNTYRIILIARLAISKLKYGKCKNLELIFDTEVQMRHRN